ncbi:Two-component hybrid sensor and regulator [Enhygromyxa salina]|uniref:histidine kinase n=1 Tax=Enhygromyxa salina TaxID=215803 RepID=A0A0C1ZMX4_9BACT|nr:HAMP domain-containing sensor histidine kinase [Enhygromyxa salina]KIG12433.1 Two-component hybrid sensor and regulator [Enhygromyxa salina]
MNGNEAKVEPIGAPDRRPPLERLVRRDDLRRTLTPFLGEQFGCIDGMAVFDHEGVLFVQVGASPMQHWEQLPPEALAALRRGGSRKFGLGGHKYVVRPCFAGADRVGSFVVAMPGGDSESSGAHEHPSEDGERSPLLVVTDALSGVLGAVLQAGFATWVTSEMHLAASESNHRALQQRNAELERAVAHLREVDQLKSNFLATVSHELRTPLTSIIGFSEMLAKGIAGPLNEEQTEYANTILERGEELLRLITQVLEMSKMEVGTMRLSLASVELSEVVGRAFSAASISADRARVHLVQELDPEIPRVVVDADKIQQVLINLISNAIKFNRPDGCVIVRAELAPMRRPFEEDFFGEETADALRVTVSDTGIGIPEDQLSRIFDAFYQVDASSTRQHGGAGLGLSIVRKLIEAHGGEAWAESIVGAGTTFHFTLPIADS